MVSFWVFTAIMGCVHGAPQMRDAVTHDELIQKHQKSVSENPLAHMKITPNEAVDPTTVKPVDILASSDILSFGGLATLVPKQAILCIPAQYQTRIKLAPGSKIVSWSDFYAANRGWIKTMEVSRTQAEGKEPFDEKTAESLSKSSMVVVATYKTGPISVLPPKIPADSDAKSSNPKK